MTTHRSFGSATSARPASLPETIAAGYGRARKLYRPQCNYTHDARASVRRLVDRTGPEIRSDSAKCIRHFGTGGSAKRRPNGHRELLRSFTRYHLRHEKWIHEGIEPL